MANLWRPVPPLAHDLAGLPDRPFHKARLILFPAQSAGKGSVSPPAAGGTGNPAPEAGRIPGGTGGTLPIRFGTARIICSANAHGFVMLFRIALAQKTEFLPVFYPPIRKIQRILRIPFYTNFKEFDFRLRIPISFL